MSAIPHLMLSRPRKRWNRHVTDAVFAQLTLYMVVIYPDRSRSMCISRVGIRLAESRGSGALGVAVSVGDRWLPGLEPAG